jgi:hypothetical protein
MSLETDRLRHAAALSVTMVVAAVVLLLAALSTNAIAALSNTDAIKQVVPKADNEQPTTATRGSRGRGSRSHPAATYAKTPVPPPNAATWSGLNARDFGAKGDGVTDDSEALQMAINAALKQQHQLLVPAGIYVVMRQLNITHSTCENPNFGCTMGLVMRGESYHLTEIHAGAKMHAVLNFSSLSGPTGPGGPIPTEGQHISDIAVYGHMQADYALFAPGILYSRFERVFAGTALISGMSFGYGWINYVENCRFSGNQIGLEIYASANAWDITNNCFEANHIGIYVSDATAILIEGSIIESVGIPIMIFVSSSLVADTHSYAPLGYQ